jgi:hypothetical protein
MQRARRDPKPWSIGPRRLAAGLAALALVLDAGGALAFECRSAQDAEAAHLRWLQTQMMVAALSCQGSVAYNEFVRKNQTTLDWSVARVNQMFARDHGAGAAALYNSFNTKLANEAAVERTRLDRNYCRVFELVYGEALQRSSTELVLYSTEPQRGAASVLPATCSYEASLVQKR